MNTEQQQQPQGPGPARRRRPSLVAVVGIVLAILVVYGIAKGSGPSSQQVMAERNVVAACWRDAGRPDAPPEKTAECERMEAGFRRKHGNSP